MNAADPFLNTDQLEQLTGIPADTWRYWGRVGRGPASVRLGHRRYWRRSVVENWIAEQEAASVGTGA